MQTAKQVAEQIININPDISDFLQLVSDQNKLGALDNINSTSNLAVKLLKCEVILMHYTTHFNLIWSDRNLQPNDPAMLLSKCISDCAITTIEKLYWDSSKYMSTTMHYDIDVQYAGNSKFANNHILYYIPEPRKYLTKYLWNKIRVTVKKPIDIKQLKPDLFSYTAFANYLAAKIKPLTSANTMRYYNQVIRFPTDIQDKYIDLLFTNSESLSIRALKELELNYQFLESNATNVKYISVPRWDIRRLANKLNIPLTPSSTDAFDSQYVPYISNVPRKVTNSQAEVRALLDALVVLKVYYNNNNKPTVKTAYEALAKHLSHPDYKEQIAKCKQEYNNYIAALGETYELISI